MSRFINTELKSDSDSKSSDSDSEGSLNLDSESDSDLESSDSKSSDLDSDLKSSDSGSQSSDSDLGNLCFPYTVFSQLQFYLVHFLREQFKYALIFWLLISLAAAFYFQCC